MPQRENWNKREQPHLREGKQEGKVVAAAGWIGDEGLCTKNTPKLPKVFTFDSSKEKRVKRDLFLLLRRLGCESGRILVADGGGGGGGDGDGGMLKPYHFYGVQKENQVPWRGFLWAASNCLYDVVFCRHPCVYLRVR